MIRLLHLMSSKADFQTRSAVDALVRGLGDGYEAQVRTIGPGGDWRSMAAAIICLRRMEAFDVVHAWGIGALSVSALAGRGRLIYTPAETINTRLISWLRAILTSRDVQVLCSSGALRQALATHGIPLDRCHLIRPGVDFSRIRRRRDAGLRRALGLADEDVVLLAAGESCRAAGHRDAAWATALLHVLDPRYKLLLWGRGSHLQQAISFSQRAALPQLVRTAEPALGRVEFEQLLPAADVVLVTATGSAPLLPVCMAMAAGLPLVSTSTRSVSELLEDRHTALVVRPGSPRMMAQRVLEVRENPSLQWQISDMARTEAYEYFAMTRFLEQHRTAYRQRCAGEPLSIPEPAPGAGRRFHGRG